jgi:single-stranded-DNA-specific exonuclease
MQCAVDRIWQAIDAEETIVVFGDYDVDGVTSTALLVRLLSELGVKTFSFIPDRMNDGYGFSLSAFEHCQKMCDMSLLVTVDCGTNSIETIAHAQANGVDVIVTDHHEPDLEVAAPIALVNPKLGKDAVLKQLAGVGVAFKLAHALIKQGRADEKAVAKTLELRDYLDLVALGTVGDLVPLLSENRTLVRHGLARLNTTRWEGLKALKIVSNLKEELTSYHLGFQLAPRINAAGRVGKPLQALELLTTNSPEVAKELADLLNQKNQERRRIEQEITDSVLKQVKRSFDFEKDRGLVIFGEEWHPGVVGIVASRVARFFHRPTVVLTALKTGGTIRGSCRGSAGFDLLRALKRCETHLKQFGGHKMAAGLELKPEALESFKEEFDRAAAEQLSDSDLEPTLYIDTLIRWNEINDAFFESVCQLRPFGPKNHEPIFLLKKAEIKGEIQRVGKKHLKFSVLTDGEVFEAIAFNFHRDMVPVGFLDFVFTLQENRWRGRRTLQLQVLDIQPAL